MTWISKLARALVGDDPAEEARAALESACSSGTRLKLEPLRTSVANATVMSAAMEQVRGDDFVISQPMIGGAPRTLVVGEKLRLRFPMKSVGGVSGETEVLGRLKIPSGGGASLRGYRLALPPELFPDDRRQGRSGGGTNLAREAELYRDGRGEPVRGIVQNLTLGGMQIRTHDSPEPPLQSGERLRLVVNLPKPVGTLNRMVAVNHLAGTRNPRHRVVGITFGREVEGLRELLARRSRR